MSCSCCEVIGAKVEAILNRLDAEGVALVEIGSVMTLIDKRHANCKHRNTDKTKNCYSPVNVPCDKWEFDPKCEEAR